MCLLFRRLMCLWPAESRTDDYSNNDYYVITYIHSHLFTITDILMTRHKKQVKVLGIRGIIGPCISRAERWDMVS